MNGELITWYVLFISFALITAFIILRNVFSTKYQDSVVRPGWVPSIYLIGFSGLLVYLASYAGLYITYKKADNKKLSFIFSISLLITILSTLWAVIFYYFQNYIWADVIILLITLATIYYAYLLYKIDNVAGILQIPLILWLVWFLVIGIGYIQVNK